MEIYFEKIVWNVIFWGVEVFYESKMRNLCELWPLTRVEENLSTGISGFLPASKFTHGLKYLKSVGFM